MHISLFGLDHLLLFLFLLPHLGSAAVPKLSHKVWADADWFLWGTNFASIRSQIVSGTSFDNGYLHLISLAISSATDFSPISLECYTGHAETASTLFSSSRNTDQNLACLRSRPESIDGDVLASRAHTVRCSTALPNCFTISVKNGFHVCYVVRRTVIAVFRSKQNTLRTLQEERNVV